ncbi:uncharacterized protein K02A2.6-like [Osmia bicornis bicornis]|uniref:uncharacterized protein K02A2.6-like n=1 Tax=Osmia bicornis bicornis TaxID=1437191 RepID=UPI001EAEEED7|nr:uncharacterized protein K02A2.6-like [Osmia bicornis bicornis]
MNSKLSVADLKEKLRVMDLPTTGTKAELINRLLEAGINPADLMMATVAVAGREENERSPESVIEHQQLGERPIDFSSQSVPSNSQLSEVKLLRRGRDVAERENQLLRRELEMLRFMPRENSLTPTHSSSMKWKDVKEMIGNYDGNSHDHNIWEKQLRQLISSYALDNCAAKALLCSKLSGKALKWYHSRSDCIEMNHEQLLTEIKKMFGQRVNSLTLRREFEARKWTPDEIFADYLHDKIMLGNRVPIPQEELIDYVIDGIPNESFRTQARIQCFQTTNALLKAFAKVSLPCEAARRKFVQQNEISVAARRTGKIMKEQKDTATPLRCYNCSSVGHFAKNCPKPKRERGSCYTCGKFGHRATECSKLKTSAEEVNYVVVQREEDDEFQRTVRLRLSEKNEFCISVPALLDSGSPISFIKQNLLPEGAWKANVPTAEFSGINNSPLEILGTVDARVALNDFENNITLYVVTNKTMRRGIILGRDFMKTANLTLMCREVQEIMNIEVDSEIKNLEKKNMMNLNEDLPNEVKERAREIFVENYLLPERPEKPIVENVMKLVLSDEKPFHCTPRRLSYTEKTQLKEIIDTLLEKKVIRESTSEYASPIVLLRKKTGEIRMCIDFRVLNKVTVRDNLPLPLIEDQLNVLSGKKYFTTLDLKDGFFHISMHPDSIKYTSFVTPLGQYEYLKMPFGLKGAPLKFQRYVTKIFKDLIDTGDVSVYLDDFLIATTTIEYHLKILKKVFLLLVENRLQLRLDKCKFLQTTLDYLGYTISAEGIT